MTPSKRLQGIVEIIETVENRCMAVDGPVTEFLRELTNSEMQQIYRLATGKPTKKK